MSSTTPAQPGPPAAPPVTDIDLSEFADIVNNARTDDERALTTPLVATAGDEYPDLAYRGSTMVFDKDHLAWWERTTGRETMANLGKNKRVAVWVRNPVRDRRPLRFYGEARVVESGPERDAVWDKVVQVEKDMDKDKKGVAVIVRVDRVRAGPNEIQRR
jgi:Pyridoxamine 5'-phosphate oxidase